MPDLTNEKTIRSGSTRRTVVGMLLAAPALGACASVQQNFQDTGAAQPGPGQAPVDEARQGATLGTGKVKIGLVLPLSAQGNAGVAAQSMRNAAEMAIAEFQNPDVEILVKDDAGTPQGANSATQQALAQGAEVILGPLFGVSVPQAAQAARARNVPVIAFSTDASVAGRGVYLLSFLPESDVSRIISYAASTGKRSFAALVPDNAYGNVVEGAFKQAVGRANGRIVAFERYGADRSAAVRNVVQALGTADTLFVADVGEDAVKTVDAVVAAGGNLRNVQLLGTGLWDSPTVFASEAMQGGLFAAPDIQGFRSFSSRYRAKYGNDPVRTASLVYDAVALMAALARTQGGQRFSPETLTSPSGFAGIDGLFRFRNEGTNERGLSIMRVTRQGGQSIQASPKSFGV